MSGYYISADYHLKTVDKCGITVNGQNSRLLDKTKSLSTIVQSAIDNKSDGFFFLGDIFDKINPSEKLRRLFVSTVIAPLVSNGIKIIILRGNHDTNFDISSFESEAMLAEAIQPGLITFITEPTEIEFPDFLGVFIPYGIKPAKGRFGKEAILFGHHGI